MKVQLIDVGNIDGNNKTFEMQDTGIAINIELAVEREARKLLTSSEVRAVGTRQEGVIFAGLLLVGKYRVLENG